MASRESDDDRLTDRLGDLFSAVKGPPRVAPAPKAAPPPPPSADRPPPAPASAGPPPPSPAGGDLATLLRHLGAQVAGVHEALRRIEQRLEQVEAKAADATQLGREVDERLEEIGRALFDWFEAFSQWQNDRFDRLDKMTTQLLGAAPPRRPAVSADAAEADPSASGRLRPA